MRKFLAFALFIAVLLGVSGCKPRLEVFTAKLVSDQYVLSWNSNVYHGYGFVDDDNELISDKFASVDTGSKNSSSIYLVKGYAPEQWVIYYDTPLMGSYVLYKADSVTEIPTEFEGVAFAN